MKLSRLHIDLIFRKTDVRKILENIFLTSLGYYPSSVKTIIKDTYVKYGTVDRPYLTEEEVLIRGEDLTGQTEEFQKRNGINNDFIYLSMPPLFGENSLFLNGDKFHIRFTELLRWRQLTHQLGEDLFTCSYLALRDKISSNPRRQFDWPSNLNANDARMLSLFGKGLSENHSHIWAAGPVFLPAWLSMMNKVLFREREFEKSGISKLSLSPEVRFWPKDSPLALYQETMWAAMIRFMLVNFIYYKERGYSLSAEARRIWPQYLEDVIKNPELLSIKLTTLNAQINVFKTLNCTRQKEFTVNLNNHKSVKINGRGEIFDYAITEEVEAANGRNIHYGAGERWLIYSMYKLMFAGDKEAIGLQYLFYTYLLIKSRFRSELVQVNDKVGFYNFKRYQDRKHELVQNDPVIGMHRLILATQGHLAKNERKFTDARIQIGDCETSIDLDNHIKFYDKHTGHNDTIWLIPREPDPDLKMHKYCIHFLKTPDTFSGKKGPTNGIFYSSYPRHCDLRDQTKNLADCIIRLRQNVFKTAERIYAIDAAGSEINTRPEVFAQAFRFLKGHYNREGDLLRLFKVAGNERKLLQLKAKYHVGEEFLDVADGLRSIHEAILFLNLDRGDSLAHLVCLGLEPEKWYAFKHHRIETRKHDYLDTAVWLMAMIEKYSIEVSRQFFNTLEGIFNKYFDELYRSGSSSQIAERKGILGSVTWRDFFEAWQLRGDNPWLYKDGKFDLPRNYKFWDRCAVNQFDICASARRDNPKISLLYHLYHFSPEVKKKSKEPLFEQISHEYVSCVVALQYYIQKEISERGIFVETLPTSNILIGASKRYDEHPILKFYNYELGTKPSNWPHLNVSINTDDAGVFNTTLENEFTLMALAMTKAKDEKGNSKYSQEAIFRWLDRVREMGNEQAPPALQ